LTPSFIRDKALSDGGECRRWKCRAKALNYSGERRRWKCRVEALNDGSGLPWGKGGAETSITGA